MISLFKGLLKFDFFSRYRMSLLLLIIMTVICNLLEVFSLGAMIPFLQTLISGESGEAGMESMGRFFSALNWLANGQPVNLLVIFGIANIFRIFLTIIRDSFKIHLTTKVRTNTQKEIFKKYMYASYERLVGKKNSDLIYNIISFPQDVGQLFNIIPQIIIGAIGLIIISSFLFFLSPEVFLYTLLVGGVLGIIIVFTFKRRLQEKGEAVVKIQAELVGMTQQGIEGFKEIKINKLESFFDSSFTEGNDRFYMNKVLVGIYSIAPSRSIEFLVFLFVTLMGSYYFQSDVESFRKYLPSVLIYVVAVFRLVSPLNLLIQDLGRLNGLSYTYILLKKILIENLEHEFENKDEELCRPIVEIELDNVSYQYESSKKALTPTNLKIKRGEVLGVVGPSGAGKSTLVNLIMGLIRSKSGDIRLIGIRGEERQSYLFRDYISYVSQDSFLFRGKVSENVTCFNDGNVEEMEKALRIADCTDFINALPDRIETMLGDRGLGFSGGQIQRICIARALYRGGDILILDEATSALDPVTEQKVLKSITKEYPDKIIIFLTHRLKSLDYADRVLFLENGTISGTGGLEDLVKENLSFEKFYNKQG